MHNLTHQKPGYLIKRIKKSCTIQYLPTASSLILIQSQSSIPSSSLSSMTQSTTADAPPTNPPRTPLSSASLTLTISLLALRIASSSAFRIVPETRITRKTHPRSRPVPRFGPFAGSGTPDIYVRADQTRRKEARGHRTMAVDVAGERYFTIGLSLVGCSMDEWGWMSGWEMEMKLTCYSAC